MDSLLIKKLSSYSGLAGSILLISNTASGQIIYTDPDDIYLLGYGASAEIDLNNDGVWDMRIKLVDEYPKYEGGFAALYSNDHYGGSHVGVKGIDYPCVTGQSGVYMALALKANAEIGGVNYKNWAGLGSSFVELFNNDTYYNSTHCQQWLVAQNRFLGFRLGHFPAFNFGWVRLSVSPIGNKIVIKDWAVNSDKNEPILAGQTMRFSDEDQMVNASDPKVYSTGKEIFVDNNTANFPLEITVFNSVGIRIDKLHSSNVTTAIDFHKLPAGIYLVNVKSDENSFTKQVVLQ